MDLEITAIFITGCFWFWTIKKTSLTITPLREENRWHLRLSHFVFALLILNQLLALKLPSTFIGPWCVSFAAALTLIYALIVGNLHKEGFWVKVRNQVVGTLALLSSAAILPFVLSSSLIIPLCYGVIFAYQVQKSQSLVFAANLQDLDALKSKLMKLESEIQLLQLEKQAGWQAGRQGPELVHHHRAVAKPLAAEPDQVTVALSEVSGSS